jgi:hypothetical protein
MFLHFLLLALGGMSFYFSELAVQFPWTFRANFLAVDASTSQEKSTQAVYWRQEGYTVSDESTAELMTQFYNFLAKEVNPAKVLGQAMLATMEKYPSLSEWAAFTLLGASQK